MVKLLLSAATLVLLMLLGKRYYPVSLSCSIIWVYSGASDKHLEHSVDRLSHRQYRSRPRFAHSRFGAAIMYPMLAVSGLFVPVRSLPPAAHAVARVVPLAYAVSLLEGIWKGDAWWAHSRNLAALALVFLVCTALSARVFRWE